MARLLQTSSDVMFSQGMLLSDDATAVIIHDSTSPANYYRFLYEGKIKGHDPAVNMDRGGIGQAM